MKVPGLKTLLILAGLILAGTLLPAVPAAAEQVVLTSKRPYWEVGKRDILLGRECSLARFTPSALGHFVARFEGKTGAGILDVAMGNGANLWDPLHCAEPDEVYYFRNPGTTSCEVFVASSPAK